ncbi:MAG: hypothetical protein AB7T37_18045 [Dehalococcoidia bacterium]
MAGAPTAATVIWRRSYDSSVHNRRWKRFGLWYCAPVFLVLAAMAIFMGPWEALGLFILVGGFGILVAGWIFFKNLGQRMNPEIRFDGEAVLWARLRVPLADVQRYSTFMSSVDGPPAFVGDSAVQVRNSVDIGVVRFGLPDHKEVEFKWPELPEDELDGLRAALDPLLPGRWRQVEGWYSPPA